MEVFAKLPENYEYNLINEFYKERVGGTLQIVSGLIYQAMEE